MFTGVRLPSLSVITRFAPSPTGLLHLGHVYAAKYAYDLAMRDHRTAGTGQFLLRFEDIDITRVRDEFYQAIEDDLHWLGFDGCREPVCQRQRLPIYQDALSQLQALGVVYPCFCTRREILQEVAAIGHAPHGPEGPHYPGICKQLAEHERRKRISSGQAHAWRLDTRQAASRLRALTFTDTFHGVTPVDFHSLGDVILSRKDIATSYHLAVVVDDADQGVTDVTRGEDLLASTHVHRMLQQLLELPEPRYHHHRLVLDDEGKRLAKRHDALSIQALRRGGHSPAEVLSMIDAAT